MAKGKNKSTMNEEAEEKASEIIQTATIAAEGLINIAKVKAEGILKVANDAKFDESDLLSRIDRHMQYASEVNKKHMREQLIEIVGDALGENPTRYIDVSRIPLICKSIIAIDESLKNIDKKYINRDQFEPFRESVKNIETNISRGVWIILALVITAVMSVVLVNK